MPLPQFWIDMKFLGEKQRSVYYVSILIQKIKFVVSLSGQGFAKMKVDFYRA